MTTLLSENLRLTIILGIPHMGLRQPILDSFIVTFVPFLALLIYFLI